MFTGNVAAFGGVITAPRTVTLNGARSAGIVTFDGSKAYTIGGSDALTLDAASGHAAVSVAGGSHTIAAPLVLADDLDVAVASGSILTISGALAAGGHSITKTGSGTARFGALRGTSLGVSAGVVSIVPGGSDAGTSRLTGLSVSAGARLDVADNRLIVAGGAASSTWNGSAYGGVLGLVASGYAGGTWDGSGIGTSRATSSGARMGLAAMTAADAGYGARGTFGGQPVAAGDVVIGYTFAGDADLNGRLDGDDYFQIDAHLGATGSAVSYHHGDFNYDGTIDGDDYFILDANLGFAAAAAAAAAVGGRGLGSGVFRPQTNYGTESQYQYGVSNFINTNQFGQFFGIYSYAADANFTANAVPEPAAMGLLIVAIAEAVRRPRPRRRRRL
jgi:hypothetical protein